MRGRHRLTSLLAAVAVTVPVTVMGAGTAAAEGERKGNWDLYVDAAGCTYEWEDQAWCGPELIVHADMFLTDDDRYSATMQLQSSNGDIPLQYSLTTPYAAGRGAQSTDPNYWGPSFDNRTPTGGLAPGTYGLTLSINVSGRWSCTIYSEDVCNFLKPRDAIYAWIFDWDETSVQVPAIKLVKEAEAKVFGRGTAKPWVQIDGSVLPAYAGTQVTIQRQTSNGKWKTLVKKQSKILGYVSYLDKKAPVARKVHYRVFATGEPDFALTVTARTK